MKTITMDYSEYEEILMSREKALAELARYIGLADKYVGLCENCRDYIEKPANTNDENDDPGIVEAKEFFKQNRYCPWMQYEVQHVSSCGVPDGYASKCRKDHKCKLVVIQELKK